MYNDEINNKKHYLIIVIIIISIITCLVYKDVSYRPNKYVNINDLVNKAYTSSKGYDSNLAKHMSKDVFNNSNAYVIYNDFVDFECKKPIRISLRLTEINQHKINGKIFIYMKYNFDALDADGKTVSGAGDVPVVFTVIGTNDNLYIEKSQEYERVNDVPKIYK